VTILSDLLVRMKTVLSLDNEQRKDFAAKYGEASFHSRAKLVLDNMEQVSIQ
jgi:hypothetical protein